MSAPLIFWPTPVIINIWESDALMSNRPGFLRQELVAELI